MLRGAAARGRTSVHVSVTVLLLRKLVLEWLCLKEGVSRCS